MAALQSDQPIDLARRLARFARTRIFPLHFPAGVAELADALDSKSSDRKIVWVRAPPPAIPLKRYFTWEKSTRLKKKRLRTETQENASKRNLFVNPSSMDFDGVSEFV